MLLKVGERSPVTVLGRSLGGRLRIAAAPAHGR